MNRRLVHDVAMAMTKAVVNTFEWDSEAARERAFMTLFPLVASGIEAYEESRARMAKRLGKREPGTPPAPEEQSPKAGPHKNPNGEST